MSNLYHPKQRRILADIVGRARYKKCRCEPVRAVLTNERDAFKPFSWMNRETRKWAGLYHASGGAECVTRLKTSRLPWIVVLAERTLHYLHISQLELALRKL